MAEETFLKFYLAEQMPFTLTVRVRDREIVLEERIRGNATTPQDTYVIRRIEGIRYAGGDDDKTALQKEVFEKMRTALRNQELNFKISATCTKKTADIRTPGTGNTLLMLTFNRDVNFDLKAVLGEGAFLQAEVFDWKESHQTRMPLGHFTTEDMPLKWTEGISRQTEIQCVDAKYNPVIATMVPGRGTRQGTRITGRMNLIAGVCKRRPISESEKTAVYKRMLQEELATDAVILCGNGAEVKCHRSFMMAHSPVFHAMFQATMLEAKTRKVEMTDISEEGVKALLAYLYHWEVSKAEESCTVAVELLNAGHKYDIRHLENDVVKLLMDKPDTWFEQEETMKLFLLIQNFADEDWESLKRKVAKVLRRWYPELRFKDSPAFKQFFRENPQAAKYFF